MNLQNAKLHGKAQEPYIKVLKLQVIPEMGKGNHFNKVGENGLKGLENVRQIWLISTGNELREYVGCEYGDACWKGNVSLL